MNNTEIKKQKPFFKAFRLLSLALLMVIPGAIWAQQTYICDLALAAHSSDGNNAKKQLTDAGYTVIDKDLNKNAGGYYIYLGYKTTTDYNDAITDIVVQDGKEYGNNGCPDIGGKKWSRVKNLNGFSGELNKDAGGAYLYMFYSKSDVASNGSAIASLWTSGSSSGSSVWRFEGTSGKDACDLNRRAGGDDIYLIRGYVSAPPKLDLCDDLNNTKEFSNVLTYTPDKPYVCFYKRLYSYADGKNCDLKVSLRNMGRETTLFEKKDYNELQWAKDNPNWADSKTTNQVPGIGKVIFKHGYYRRVTNMQTGETEYWEEIRVYLSKVPADGQVVVTQTHAGQTVSVARRVECNFENVNIIDPILNLQADSANVGEQVMYVSSTFDIDKVEVYRDDGSFSFADDFTRLEPVCAANDFKNPKVPEVILPPTDTIMRCVAVFYTFPKATNNKDEADYYHRFPIQFEYKGFHSVKGLEVAQIANPDSAGVRYPYNQISWYTTKVASKNSNDEDVLETDQFLVLRSQYPDFRNYTTLGSVGLDEYDKKLSNDTMRVYVFDDEDDGCDIGTEVEGNTTNILHNANYYTEYDEHWPQKDYNNYIDYTEIISQYRIPERRLYYRVVRASVYSQWPTIKKKYSESNSEVMRSSVAPISEVTITKNSNYEEDQTVKLKVRLDNPYMWDLKESLSSAGREYYKQLAYANGDSCRMFTWDENVKIVITRSGYKGEKGITHADYANKTITINGDEVKFTTDDNGYYYAEIEDTHEYPYTRYYYSATLDASKSSFPIYRNDIIIRNAKDCYSTTAGLITNFAATRGTQDGLIKVSWEITEGLSDGFTLYRRSEDQKEWTGIQLPNVHDTAYVDYDVKPGVVYEYKVIAKCNWEGMNLDRSYETWGYPSLYGTISGRVLLSDGSPYPGKQAVEVKSNDDITVAGKVFNEVTLYDDITQAKNTTIKAETDSLGYYTIKVLLNPSEATTSYSVHVNGLSDITAYLGNGKEATVKDKNLIYKDCYTIEGRVLYEGSTVPVNGAKFTFNDAVIFDHDNKPITTDTKGNFSFIVPGGIEATMKVWKENHVMHNGGYIMGGLSGEDTTFVVDKNYKDKLLQDDTKVRLVGRMIGGNKQGNLPVGLGQTKNNLGDNLTIVLQLEGNNTAQIVYDNDNPDLTTRKASFKQAVSKNGVVDSLNTTEVSFEKKRIVINPNTTTGEFCVDLIPAKYKVSQLSAKGYSTLYKESEGFDVIDLNENIDEFVVEQQLDDNTKLQTKTNAVYNKIYHVPATVTYKQLLYGTMEVDYLGEQKVKEKNLIGVKNSMTVAEVDKKNHTVNYVFGYPVFKQGETYTFEVAAHEDYYYNNVKGSNVDKVNLDGGKLIVRNGLVSGTDQQKLTLKEDGTQTFSFVAQNVAYVLTDTAALRSINVAVDLNDYYYEAAQTKGFVIGHREMGKDVKTLSTTGEIMIVDVLRDPPGSKSSAYRNAGTTYNWTHNYQYDYTSQINIAVSGGPGSSFETGVDALGIVTTTKSEWSVTLNGKLNIPIQSEHNKTSSSYTMTLNEKISTSSGIFDNGANSDVYVGVVSSYDIGKVESFCMIDDTTYQYVKGAIDRGAVKLLRKGQDAEGNKFYLVLGDKLAYGAHYDRTFAYTQKHITGIIIPQLEEEYEAMLVDGDSATLQQMAETTGQPYYLRTKDGYIWITPKNYSGIDRAGECSRTIDAWWDVIYDNEAAKINAMQNSTPIKRYSLGSVDLTYSESTSAYYNYIEWEGSTKISGGGGFGYSRKKMNNGRKKTSTEYVDDSYTDYQGNYKESSHEEKSSEGKFPGFNFSFSINGGATPSETDTKTFVKTSSAGYGFTLGTNDNGYMDVDVYGVETDLTNLNNDQKDFVLSAGGTTTDKQLAQLHNFIFVQRGGAMRNPWLAPDSTLTIEDGSGKAVPLAERLLKIDNPKIYVDKPVVSNIPQDQKAVFNLRICNESEISDHSSQLVPTKFVLQVDDKTNPNGAKIYIDGLPLAGTKNIAVGIGKTIYKTIEVERGVAYDYDNIKLKLGDKENSLIDLAAISVHYLPTATPVKITTPVNGWVMNTLSPTQDSLYYIPVQISGFDINSDGFHHIEFQYKKQTDGEDQWVNLCSYFASDSLYNMATGQKQMIEGGAISNIRFFGEADPVEMKYDLRAVSFRSVGTGFVTNASDVVSGTKDTSRPRVFGVPKPASGILTYADVISLPFNEPIAYNYLDKTANFQVMGYTNNTKGELLTNSLHFDGSDEQSAKTIVNRNLSSRDFALELCVKPSSLETMIFASQYDDNNNEMMFYTSSNCLAVTMYSEGEVALFATDELPQTLASGVHQVGFNFHESDKSVEFLFDGTVIDTAFAYVSENFEYRGNGPILFGNTNNEEFEQYDGDIYDARLWAKTVTPDMRSTYTKKQLTGRESGLMAYWPMVEGLGSSTIDKVNGADLQLKGVTWNICDGFSLNLNKETVELDKPAYIEQNTEADYTVDFWFNALSVGEAGSALLTNGSDNLRHSAGMGLKIDIANTGLAVSTRDTTFMFNANVVNREWHRATLSVSHSTNVAKFYLDGKLQIQQSASEFGGLAGTSLQLGDNTYVGNIDNLCIWELALPESYIKDYYNYSPTGNEMGLKLFIPFHENKRSEQNDIIIAFSSQNKSANTSPDGMHKCGLVTLDSQQDRKLKAPLVANDNLTNLGFDWTSTNNELQINLKEVLSDINHQNVTLVVRGVEDLAGNPMASPQMWTIYVDQNVLTWDKQTINETVEYGKSKTLTADWANRGGKPINYTITCDASWLELSESMGKANPLQESDINMTISDGLAPGAYSTIVYLTDQDNLVSPLEVNVTVKADEPDWKVDRSKYNQTMNIMAQVYQTRTDGTEYINSSTTDIIAAFVDSEVVGVGHISKSKDMSYLYLNVYGNENTKNKDITFYLWDSSTGKVRNLEADSVIKFQADVTIGTPPAEPLILTCSDRSIQIIKLNKGWNWISFNIEPTAKRDVNKLFINNSPFSNQDMVKDDARHSEYNLRTGKWIADTLDISYNKIYRIYMGKEGSVQIAGKALTNKQLSIHLTKGWNEFPYMLETAMPISVALNDYQKNDKATEGDILKGLEQFAVLYKDFGWVGTLETLRPGEGYYLYRNATGECDVQLVERDLEESDMTTTKSKAFRSIESTPVIAAFEDASDFEGASKLYAFTGDECVGEATLITLPDGEQRYFLSVNADRNETINLVVEKATADDNGDVRSNLYTAGQVICNASTSVGTIDEPLILSIKDANIIQGSSSAYDLQGRKYSTSPARGLIIQDGKKTIKQGKK